MINLSAETFPDDSIINNVSIQQPPPLNSLPLPSPLRPLVLTKQQSINNDETTHQLPPSLLTQFQSIDQALPLSPACADINFTSTSSSSNVKSFTKSGKAAASSVSGATGRRIGAAFKPSLLSKKSTSVDSLHRQAGGQRTAADNLRSLLATRTDDDEVTASLPKRHRSMRYDHVQSKVKVFIETQREEDNRRRSLKLQRHRSMPESLCCSMGFDAPVNGTAAAAVVDAAIDSDPVAKLAELRATLQLKEQQLAEMEIQKKQFYESSMRDSDERLRLERKVDTMRLALLQANDERHQCQEKLQQLQQQQLKLKEQTASRCSSASAATSTTSTTSSSAYPPSSTVGSSRSGSSSGRHRGGSGGGLNVSYGLASSSGVSSASANAAYVTKPVYRHDAHLGLHHRQSFKLTADNGGRSSGIGNTSGSSASSVHHVGRPIIMHSSNSDYRLLGSAAEDDDIALFEQSPGDCPIITSSSMSHDLLTNTDGDDVGDAANHGFAMPMGTRWCNGADGGDGGFRKQRLTRAIRKRLRRMWRRCTPCLSDGSGGRGGRGHADQAYDEDISMLYTGLNEGGDETAATATTGYNSF